MILGTSKSYIQIIVKLTPQEMDERKGIYLTQNLNNLKNSIQEEDQMTELYFYPIQNMEKVKLTTSIKQALCTTQSLSYF